MHPVHFVDREAIHQAVADHRARPGAALLRRLKDDDGRAGEVARFRKVLRCAEQHRGMPVMPAGVHVSGHGGFIGELVRLLDRQRVHVGAEPDALARAFLAADHPDHAGLADARRDLVATERLEPLSDEPGGAVDVVAQLRMRMQVAPPRGDLGMQVGDAIHDRHGSPRPDAPATSRVSPEG